MDLDTARLTVSPRCLSLIDSLPPYPRIDPLTLGEQLRKGGANADVVAAALTQSRLRHQAQGKFGEFARGMLFTASGLEQATRLTVAARHAARYRDAGIKTVADLTAGIGADAMAMAGLGLGVIAFERDEATALIADHNLRHWERAAVVHADSLATLAKGSVNAQGVFADPARRNARGRRHDPKDYSPPLDDVLALRGQFPALGVKVGPGIPHEALPTSASGDPVETQWVSVEGSVVEAAIWCGPLAHAQGHSALVMKGNQAHLLTGTTEHAHAGPLGDWLMEPDGAVIRAGLVGELAEQAGAHLVDATIAYLTADHEAHGPFMSTFRVLETLPYSVKRLGEVLKSRGVGTVEIKKRGMDVVPEQLRKSLKLKGDSAATVVLTRVAGTRTALIVERVTQSAD